MTGNQRDQVCGQKTTSTIIKDRKGSFFLSKIGACKGVRKHTSRDSRSKVMRVHTFQTTDVYQVLGKIQNLGAKEQRPQIGYKDNGNTR